MSKLLTESDKIRLFRGPVYDLPSGPRQTYHTNADARAKIVRESDDRDALLDALSSRNRLQTTVVAAIQRRLRQLDRRQEQAR